jgi:hypothetical protein
LCACVHLHGTLLGASAADERRADQQRDDMADPIKLNVTAKCSICDQVARVPLPIESTPRKRVMICPVCDMIPLPVTLRRAPHPHPTPEQE